MFSFVGLQFGWWAAPVFFPVFVWLLVSAAASRVLRPVELDGWRWAQRFKAAARTGACHLSGNQPKKWGPNYFNPAVTKVAEQTEFSDILGATPYSLRRGGISVRLRAEDAQTVAKECGTSLQMLDAHYAFAIDDLRRFGPRPVDIEWRAARAARQGTESKRSRLRVVA